MSTSQRVHAYLREVDVPQRKARERLEQHAGALVQGEHDACLPRCGHEKSLQLVSCDAIMKS
jgi:hypothetical protein